MGAKQLFIEHNQTACKDTSNSNKTRENEGVKNSANQDKALLGIHILVVDDSTINQVVAQKTLQKYGAKITTASDGKSGLDTYVDNNFDLILMDIEMPVLNGFEATELIKKTKKYQDRKIPILAYTTCSYEEVKVRMEATDMDGYISKPFNPAGIMKDIAHRVKR